VDCPMPKMSLLANLIGYAYLALRHSQPKAFCVSAVNSSTG
jgi:hypothetical protein